jgi:hypothetical protein
MSRFDKYRSGPCDCVASGINGSAPPPRQLPLLHTQQVRGRHPAARQLSAIMRTGIRKTPSRPPPARRHRRRSPPPPPPPPPPPLQQLTSSPPLCLYVLRCSCPPHDRCRAPSPPSRRCPFGSSSFPVPLSSSLGLRRFLDRSQRTSEYHISVSLSPCHVSRLPPRDKARGA